MSDEAPKVKKSIVTVDGERCKGCELCMYACPRECVYKSDKLNQSGYNPADWNYEGKKGECTGCGICYTICPEAAIEVKQVRKDGQAVPEGQ